MSTAAILGGGIVAALAAVWTIAYRVGFREGRETIPLRSIAALAEHRLACERMPAERVVRELTDALEMSEPEARRLVERLARREEAPRPVAELRPAS